MIPTSSKPMDTSSVVLGSVQRLYRSADTLSAGRGIISGS